VFVSIQLVFTDVLPSALDIFSSSGTATNSVNSNYFPTSDWIGEIRPASRYPYTYPYFLFPPTHKIPLALASHRPATSIDSYAQFHANRTTTNSTTAADATEHFNRIYNNSPMHKFQQHFSSSNHNNNVSNVIVEHTADAGRMHQKHNEMRRQFAQIGEMILRHI